MCFSKPLKALLTFLIFCTLGISGTIQTEPYITYGYTTNGFNISRSTMVVVWSVLATNGYETYYTAEVYNRDDRIAHPGYVIYNNEYGGLDILIKGAWYRCSPSTAGEVIEHKQIRQQYLAEQKRLTEEYEKKAQEYKRTHPNSLGVGYAPNVWGGLPSMSFIWGNVFMEYGYTSSGEPYKENQLSYTPFYHPKTPNSSSSATGINSVTSLGIGLSFITNSKIDSSFFLLGYSFICENIDYDVTTTHYNFSLSEGVTSQTKTHSTVIGNWVGYWQIGAGYTFNKNFPFRFTLLYNAVEEIKFTVHWLFF